MRRRERVGRVLVAHKDETGQRRSALAALGSITTVPPKDDAA
jgi:hypothetical protein